MNKQAIDENYIEHEVQLRVHSEKFKQFEKHMEKIENKLNWVLGVIVTSIVIPFLLRFFNIM